MAVANQVNENHAHSHGAEWKEEGESERLDTPYYHVMPARCVTSVQDVFQPTEKRAADQVSQAWTILNSILWIHNNGVSIRLAMDTNVVKTRLYLSRSCSSNLTCWFLPLLYFSAEVCLQLPARDAYSFSVGPADRSPSGSPY